MPRLSGDSEHFWRQQHPINGMGFINLGSTLPGCLFGSHTFLLRGVDTPFAQILESTRESSISGLVAKEKTASA